VYLTYSAGGAAPDCQIDFTHIGLGPVEAVPSPRIETGMLSHGDSVIRSSLNRRHPPTTVVQVRGPHCATPPNAT
jgi:hypothetical protein